MRKMSSTLSSSSHRSRNSSNKEDTTPKPPLDVGDIAPDFELVDHEGKSYKLSDFRGRRVLLSFFRYAGTSFFVCMVFVCMSVAPMLTSHAHFLFNIA